MRLQHHLPKKISVKAFSLLLWPGWPENVICNKSNEKRKGKPHCLLLKQNSSRKQARGVLWFLFLPMEERMREELLGGPLLKGAHTEQPGGHHKELQKNRVTRQADLKGPLMGKVSNTYLKLKRIFLLISSSGVCSMENMNRDPIQSVFSD